MSKAAVMLEVIAAFNAGRAIQGSPKGANDWRDCPEPAWAWDRVDYRIKPEPEDIIPWDAVADEWKWAARDEDGVFFFYRSEPKLGSEEWLGGIGNHASVKGPLRILEAPSRPWDKSLQKRPEKPVGRGHVAGVLELPGMMSFQQAAAASDKVRELIRTKLPETMEGIRLVDKFGRVVLDETGITFHGGPPDDGNAAGTDHTGDGMPEDFPPAPAPYGKHGEGCEFPSTPGVALHIQKFGRGNRDRQASEEERRAAENEQAPSFADRFARSIERRINGLIPAPKRD